MLYDTEFLIAYTSGYRGVGKARAARFLAQHEQSGLFISRITWMEFSSGVATRAEADQAMSRFSILEIDDKLAWHAARVRRYLQSLGTPIGDHDV
jgi:predicted nucleic acid-binding protein